MVWLLPVIWLNGGCERADPQPFAERLNLEISGTPECLAKAIAPLSELGIGMIAGPEKWNANHIGTMEVGQMSRAISLRAIDRIEALQCIRSIKQVPCRSATDLDFCKTPRRMKSDG